MDNPHSADVWRLTLAEMMARLGTSEKGLSNEEATIRIAEHGQNEIETTGGRHFLTILAAQFSNALVLVLIIAAAISFFLGDTIEALVIFSIVALNALLGFAQEYRAERALDELRNYVSMKSKVMRAGEIMEVDSRDLAPGDIVYLSMGDLVPADIRLAWSESFAVNESALTGESVPVHKGADETPSESSGNSPQEIKNGVFMGTSVESGEAHGIVVATGKATFFGRTAAFLKDRPAPTEFEKSIKNFSAFLLRVTVFMTVFIFAANALLGKGVLNSFVFALALAVGITPEVLPVIITVSLSHGALALAKKSVVVKKLSSIEDLGNIDTLCCDKTGTLTQGELKLERYESPEGRKESKVLVYSMLCNSAKFTRGKKLIGHGIDRAILQSSDAAAMKRQAESFTVLEENPFDFERRRMSVLVREGKRKTLIVKGAPYSVIGACHYSSTGGKKARLDESIRKKMEARAEQYESEGFVVIAVAEKELEKASSHKSDETNLTLLGFLLFSDPPKATVRESLKHLQNIGVRIKILSGDSPLVTRKICNEVGLGVAEDRIVNGNELEGLSPAQFDDYAMRYNVFSRVTPEQKYRIVNSLNREGHVVGFLGDGINDAPALNAADVGISVDSGADVAKDASDIILLQKSLHVLGTGIVEGRKTFGNITKYILITVSSNYGNMFTVAFSSLFMAFIPLLPSQILLNNFLEDAPMLAISTDRVDSSFLSKPKKWDIKLIRDFMVFFGILSSAFDLIVILPLLVIFRAPIDVFRTTFFVYSIFTALAAIIALRTRPPFYRNRPSNLLVLGMGGVALASLAIVFSGAGKALFGFTGLPEMAPAFIIAITLLYFLALELAKWHFYRKYEAKA